MSDDIAPVTDADPNVGAPDTGDVEASAPEVPVLDVDQYSDYRVPVKLDGEELSIPLAEAIAGYQRQADYTRKTQELAQQRESLQFAATLQTALEKDPAATIDLLSRHYGISRAEAQQMVDSYEDSFEDLDPAEQKMRELDRRIAQFEEYQSQQQIEQEINRLKARYSDFDVNEVVQTALRLGTTDLEGTYKQMAYDRLIKAQELREAAETHRQAEQSKIVEQKREAAVVSGGSSATGNTTSEVFEPITSIADAWEAAKRSFNAEF